MKPIQEFCQKRGISDPIREAFVTYIKPTFSSQYAIRTGDTLGLMLTNITQERLEELWVQFLSEFKQILWSES